MRFQATEFRPCLLLAGIILLLGAAAPSSATASETNATRLSPIQGADETWESEAVGAQPESTDEFSVDDPFSILQAAWANTADASSARFSGSLEKRLRGQDARYSALWMFTGAYVSPDRQYLTYPAIGDVSLGEVIQIGDEAWIKQEDGSWGATDPRYAPPFTFWTIASDDLAPFFRDLTATDLGSTFRLAAEYDVLQAMTSDATRFDLGFDDLPEADLVGITGSLNFVVDRETMRILQLEVIQVLPVADPRGPAGMRGPARQGGAVEARLIIDYFDFDDPAITIDPPFAPRSVRTFRPADWIEDASTEHGEPRAWVPALPLARGSHD